MCTSNRLKKNNKYQNTVMKTRTNRRTTRKKDVRAAEATDLQKNYSRTEIGGMEGVFIESAVQREGLLFVRPTSLN